MKKGRRVDQLWMSIKSRVESSVNFFLERSRGFKPNTGQKFTNVVRCEIN